MFFFVFERNTFKYNENSGKMYCNTRYQSDIGCRLIDIGMRKVFGKRLDLLPFFNVFLKFAEI